MTTSLTEVRLAKRLPFLAREILVQGSIFSFLALVALVLFTGQSWLGVLLWGLVPLIVLLLCAAWRPSKAAENARTLFHEGSWTTARVLDVTACDDADEDDYAMTLSVEIGQEHVEVTHRCSYRCPGAPQRTTVPMYVITHAQRRLWGVVHSKSGLY